MYIVSHSFFWGSNLYISLIFGGRNRLTRDVSNISLLVYLASDFHKLAV